jgi:V/A-type H+-transporting ATPase subunit E
MGLDGMVDEILERGRRETAAIRAEADAEYEKAVAEAKGRVAERYEKAINAARNAAEMDRKHELSSAELDVRRALLATQKDILARVLQEAEARLRSMPPDKGRAMVKHLISNYKDEGTRVHCRPVYKDLVTTLTSLRYSGDVTGLGGIILEDDKGEVRVDHTFDTIVREAYEAKMKAIYSLLFPFWSAGGVQG